MAKKRTLSIYLLTPDVQRFEQAFSEKIQLAIKQDQVNSYAADTIGKGARAYLFPNVPKEPSWAKDLQRYFGVRETIRSMSPSAVIGFNTDGRKFFLTFGHSHSCVDFSKTESDFGLKVAINFVNENKIRGLEHSNLGLSVRDAAQAAGVKDLSSFRLDDALDLIRKVTGYAEENDFADVVTGSRSLRFSKEISLEELPETASAALKLFHSKAYSETPFEVIDMLSPIEGDSIVEALDTKMLENLKSREATFEIGFPEFVPDDICSFRFERSGINAFHPDLTLELYQNELGDRLQNLTLEELRKHRVAAYDINQRRSMKSWSLYTTLVGSVALNGCVYALNEGRWYQVEAAYKNRADTEFNISKVGLDPELGTFITKVSNEGKRSKLGYETEEDYNARIGEKTS